MKVDKDGFRFSAYFFIAAVLCFFVSTWLSILVFALSIWCLYFFRDPDRGSDAADDDLLSPADGKVIFIGDGALPTEIGIKSPGPMQKISIFMNIVNVHVNRSIADGVIKHIVYMPGKFFNASFDKASEWNERNSFVLYVPKHETSVVFVQIAGLIARRIRCDVNEGDTVSRGQRVGIIRFGSRLDVYVPKDSYDVTLKVGQKTVAGETVIAKFKAKN